MSGAVLEEVGDALFLHQPETKAQSLSRYCTQYSRLRVGRLEGHAKVGAGGEARSFQHFLDDLRRGELLEDPAVVPVEEAPRARHDRQVIGGELLSEVALTHPRDEAVHVARLALVGVHRQQRGLADHVVEGDGALFGGDDHLEAEELGQALVSGEADDAEGLGEAVDLEQESIGQGHGSGSSTL